MKSVLFVFFIFGIANKSIAQGVDGKKIFNIIPPLFKKKMPTSESVDAIKFIPPVIEKGGRVKAPTLKICSNKTTN